MYKKIEIEKIQFKKNIKKCFKYFFCTNGMRICWDLQICFKLPVAHIGGQKKMLKDFRKTIKFRKLKKWSV